MGIELAGLTDVELAALGIDDDEVGARRGGPGRITAPRRYSLGLGSSGPMAAAAPYALDTGNCPFRAFRPDRLVLIASDPEIVVTIITSGSVNMHQGNPAPAQGWAPNAIGTSYEGHTITSGNSVRVNGTNGTVAAATVSGFFAGPAIQ
jgi:hypothetical protein